MTDPEAAISRSDGQCPSVQSNLALELHRMNTANKLICGVVSGTGSPADVIQVFEAARVRPSDCGGGESSATVEQKFHTCISLASVGLHAVVKGRAGRH